MRGINAYKTKRTKRIDSGFFHRAARSTISRPSQALIYERRYNPTVPRLENAANERATSFDSILRYCANIPQGLMPASNCYSRFVPYTLEDYATTISTKKSELFVVDIYAFRRANDLWSNCNDTPHLYLSGLLRNFEYCEMKR